MFYFCDYHKSTLFLQMKECYITFKFTEMQKECENQLVPGLLEANAALKEINFCIFPTSL